MKFNDILKGYHFEVTVPFFCYHSNLFQKFVHLILTLHMQFSCRQLSGYICIRIGLVFMEMLATLKIPGLKCTFKRVYHPIKVYIRMTSNLLDLLRTISQENNEKPNKNKKSPTSFGRLYNMQQTNYHNVIVSQSFVDVEIHVVFVDTIT